MLCIRLLRYGMTLDLAVHHSQLVTNKRNSGILVSEHKSYMSFEVHNNEVHRQDQTEEPTTSILIQKRRS